MLTFDQLPEINSERWLSLEDLDGEVWKDVVGYEGIYKVSNYGRVKSLERIYLNRASEPNGATRLRKERILEGCLDNYGYWKVSLKIPNCKMRGHLIHRLVAVAFIPNPKCKDQIDHIDTNKQNNTVTNLRWCTAKENKRNPLTYRKHLEMVWSMRSPVVMLDKFGEHISNFESVTDAANYLDCQKSEISESAKKGHLCNGYRFVYASEYNKEDNFCTITSQSSLHRSVNLTSVVVYRNGNVADAFFNHKEAAQYYGVNKSMISRRCTFYNNPNGAKKVFKTPINGTDVVFNFGDVNDEDKQKAIEILKRKSLYT